MKKISILFFFLWIFSFGFCSAQQYWNEWIKYNQQYYKIPITQNGIYRLDYTQLVTAGISASNINLHQFQIFFRGQEQYIYIEDQNGNDTFDLNDYIEFYGQKNDGSLDSTLYKGDFYNQPTRHPNPYYSLFNDTSMYFLTWNNSANNKRILLDVADTNYTSFPTPSDYFMKEIISENHSDYYYGYVTGITNIHFPNYDQTEGWA